MWRIFACIRARGSEEVRFMVPACFTLHFSLKKKNFFFKHNCPGGTVGKHSPASGRDMGDSGSIPGSGRSPGEGNGSPLQQSCLENPVGGGACWVTVRRVPKRVPKSRHILACRQALLATSTLQLPWFFLLLSTPTHMLVHKKGVLLELHVNLLKTQQSK